MTPELQEALIHHRNHRLDEAALGYEAILAANPRDFDALFYLSQVRFAQRQPDEAYALMHEASTLRPDSIEAQHQVGALLLALNRPNQAIPQLLATVERAPTHAQAYVTLGTALRAVERFEEAQQCYRRALELTPDSVDALRGLANVFAALELPEAAIPPLERLLELQPRDARAHAALAAPLRNLGRWDEALAHCNLALEIDPNLAEAHANLGSVELELGRIEEARSRFERAIALSPDNASYYSRLAAVTRFSAGDPRLATLERLAGNGALWKTERINLHFALGKAYEDAGDSERAFQEFLRGNALKRSSIAYDEPEMLGSLARTSAIVTADFVRARLGWGFPSELPVFIVGMPRSGTTLIEQILASHPAVYAGGELPDFARIARCVLMGDETRAIDVPAMIRAGNAELAEIGRRYVETVAALSPHATRITDKMPANATYIGLVHLALPRARLIRARRDPVDTCLSCFSILFAQGQDFSYDLSELGRYYRAYEALLDHWETALPPGTILDVRYERLVDDFETEARRIVEFCGLPWDDACLRFYETKRPVQTASVVQVRQPIYRSSVGKWHRYAHRLTPLLDALGVPAPS